jgi:hypothetical protein
MAEAKNDIGQDAPFGTEPRRGRHVLLFWGIVLTLWVAFLIVMAWRYPAR